MEVYVLVFCIVLNLFMIYIVEIDHLVDVNQENVSGVATIYNHYLIFFGLSFITVSISFFAQSHPSMIFTSCLLYLGILLLTLGTILHSTYNKVGYHFKKYFIAFELSVPVLGLVASLAFLHNITILVAIATVSTFIQSLAFVFYKK